MSHKLFQLHKLDAIRCFRFYSTQWSSNSIRTTFIEYFKKYDHEYVHSSSVLPRKGDGTYFVNAGMNQFKSKFLGTVQSDSYFYDMKRVVNSQKCIRVGGKHNDLDEVGQDFRHHTFFEMLGSWSFGDYFKEEACFMAWDLLTNVYKIPPNRLYVTYFGGDAEMQIPPDLHCLEIWRNLGVPEDRIIPCGKIDNFWDMGETGPCGPCTEIHYDFIPDRNASHLVNVDDRTIIELWNLVFMQYNRQKDQKIVPLPQNHVDTGMGLERITAVLQGVTSNYDTDLFVPIFKEIASKSSTSLYNGTIGKDDIGGIDTAYRIVADHLRMATVAISDGLIPDRKDLGSKLRNVIFRAVNQSSNVLNLPQGSLSSLVYVIGDILEEGFPEIKKNIKQVAEVIDNTEEDYLKKKMIGQKCLHKAIQKFKPTESKLTCKQMIDIHEGNFGFTVSSDILHDICQEFGIDCEWGKIKLQQNDIMKLKDQNVELTDDSAKYDRTLIDKFSSSIVGIYKNENFIDKIKAEDEVCGLIMDKSCFYAESGGQVADLGLIKSRKGTFKVLDVQKTHDYVLHYGKIIDGEFSVNDEVECQLDFVGKDRRNSCSRAHTATHIINFALNKALGNVHQRGSYVDEDRLSFDFYCSKRKIRSEDLEEIESITNDILSKGYNVKVLNVPFKEAFDMEGVRMLQDEDYPSTVRLVTVGKNIDCEELKNGLAEEYSVELCGGTHVENTRQIDDIVITNIEGQAQGLKRLIAVTGQAASEARINAASLLERYSKLQKFVLINKDVEAIEKERSDVLKSLFHGPTLPKITRDEVKKMLEELQHTVINKLKKEGRVTSFFKKIKDLVNAANSSEKPFAAGELEYRNARDVVKILADKEYNKPIFIFSKSKRPNNPQQCVCYVPQHHKWFTAREISHEICTAVKGEWRIPNKHDRRQLIFVLNFDTTCTDKAIEVVEEICRNKGRNIYR
ncbi:DgyrCDS12695 [Dimorphilus gyrociliatus]|uniref:Alanine--tRNA ligase n=1 Tax=Dimorphilus gyrociliatus TaxID=2664684 RepID=A0A7I8W897_9ANNE|nr:DgyrCDS12695 [Dimorphilus gyrociliatus]